MNGMDALFLRRRDDDAALSAIETALVNSGEDPVDVADAMIGLRKRPLIRWFVLRAIRSEVRGAGLAADGQIDWDAIGDFLVKIAPIIFEIIKLFL